MPTAHCPLITVHCPLITVHCQLSYSLASMCLPCGLFFFFFQAEDGIRDAQESRGLGDVYKRQALPDGGRMLSYTPITDLVRHTDDPAKAEYYRSLRGGGYRGDARDLRAAESRRLRINRERD